MKLNGALKPHQGVCRAFGHSSGAKKYRDKRCMRRHWVRLQKKYTSNCDNNDTLFVVNNKRRIAQEQPKQEQHEQKLEQSKNSNNIRRSNFNENNNNNNIASTTKTTTCVAQQFQQQPQPQQQQRNAAIVSAREDCSATNARVAVSSWALMSLELLLLQPLMSCCANLVKNIIVVVASVMRVKQSLVPKSSCTPKMFRSAAAAVGGLSGPVGTAAMAFGQLKKCHRQPDNSFVYDPTKVSTLVLCLFYAITILPYPVVCDDGDNFFAVNSFSMGPEPTPPEFDYASRGQKKFGDKCDNTLECGFPGSICDPKKKSCQCTEDLPVTNHIDKCGKEAAVNESCFFNEQCEVKYFQTECRDGRCVCRFEMTPIWGKDGSIECKGRQEKRGPETYIDPAMIGVLVGMALMFVIICVVLRLFSQARWRENRTIFNTPNPRLMNVSLLRDSKLLHGQERRGSRMSVRAPSRQPSMASLRPHSPNPSLGKTGSNSHSGSNASATSLRSNRSNSVAPGNAVNSHHERKGSAHHQQHLNQQQHEAHQHHHHHHPQQQQHEPLMTNITSNPADENVTVEIIVPEKK